MNTRMSAARRSDEVVQHRRLAPPDGKLLDPDSAVPALARAFRRGVAAPVAADSDAEGSPVALRERVHDTLADAVLLVESRDDDLDGRLLPSPPRGEGRGEGRTRRASRDTSAGYPP